MIVQLIENVLLPILILIIVYLAFLDDGYSQTNDIDAEFQFKQECHTKYETLQQEPNFNAVKEHSEGGRLNGCRYFVAPM